MRAARRRVVAGSTLRLLLVALLVAPFALAQEGTGTPVLVDRIDGGELVADAGQPAYAQFRLLNLDADSDHYVTVSVVAPRHWSARAPEPFFLGPRQTANVTLELTPADTPRGEGRFEVEFEFHAPSGAVWRVAETVEVGSSAAPRVVGIFENPLGPPLDNAYGSFLLDMLFWVGMGVLSVVVGGWLVRLILLRAKSETTRDMVRKLRRPVFFLVLLLGLAQSFAILPRNPLSTFVQKFLIAIAVTVFGLYVLYRTLDAALLYYQREIAPKTQTTVDDVVVPAIRKVGLIVIYVIGIVLTLRTLGWDPTLIFAGAGIAGLVIAFAAQDTFSNLFSGLFLILDRPFSEGDIILLETGEVARVESIGLRTTDLYEYDHHHVITVPNNQLATKRIVNYSAPDSNFRVDIFVSVGYGSDVEKVEEILRDAAMDEAEVVKVPPWEPAIQLREFQDSGMMFMLRVTLNDPRDRNRVPSKLRRDIKRRFDEAGIEIPFPQRVVHVKGDAARFAP